MFDIVAAIGVLILLGSVTLFAKHFSKYLSPEGSRKMIHVSMGCAALAFPIIIEHALTIVLLGGAAIAFLLFLRMNKGLRIGMGTALLGVERKSLGDIYFVISIIIVFVLHKSTFEYIIPIAILTFADSVAALVGVSYGRYNMAQHDQEATKSREGSVMFFIVAFICALVPLQLMTEIGRAEVLFISALIGILAAGIEVISRYGNDNLLLPLLTYSILRYNISQTLEVMFTNFGIMLLLVIVVFIVYKITNITRLSMVYSLVVGYVLMMLGGPVWMLPALTLYLAFGILPGMKSEERQIAQSYKIIECGSIVGVICLYTSVFFPEYRDALYISFSLSFAVHLAINTYSRLINFENKSIKVSVIWGLIKSIVFIALPALAITRMSQIAFLLYLIFTATSLLFAVILNKKYDYKTAGDITFNANKTMVGALTAIFIAILVVGGGL